MSLLDLLPPRGAAAQKGTRAEHLSRVSPISFEAMRRIVVQMGQALQFLKVTESARALVGTTHVKRYANKRPPVCFLAVQFWLGQLWLDECSWIVAVSASGCSLSVLFQVAHTGGGKRDFEETVKRCGYPVPALL